MRFYILLLLLFLAPFGLLKASPADLRRQDQQLAQKQIRIIHTAPLKVSGALQSIVFEGRTHSVLSEDQLLQLDSQLRSRNFADAYKKDGCYAKSHLISYELSRLGIEHSKALISGGDVGDITIIDGAKVYWFKYHISPLVLVQLNSGEIKPFILDLSFSSAPISLDKWSEIILKTSKRARLKNEIVPPQQIDDEWTVLPEQTYSVDILFRFETEVDALNFLLTNPRK